MLKKVVFDLISRWPDTEYPAEKELTFWVKINCYKVQFS